MAARCAEFVMLTAVSQQRRAMDEIAFNEWKTLNFAAPADGPLRHRGLESCLGAGSRSRCAVKRGPYISIGNTIEILGTGATRLFPRVGALDAGSGSARSAAT
jgi:hypothetical protein